MTYSGAQANLSRRIVDVFVYMRAVEYAFNNFDEKARSIQNMHNYRIEHNEKKEQTIIISELLLQ